MLARLRWLTAGESHGQGVLSLLEGIPAGFHLDIEAIDRELARRQGGYGRGRRMSLEADHVAVLAGLKRGRTMGAPLVLMVRNKDRRLDSYRRLTRPRPGHADLPGVIKFGLDDCADVMERASARETAARVAAGGVALQVLAHFGVEVFSWVSRIGEVPLAGQCPSPERRARRDASPLYSLDPEGDRAACAWIDAKRAEGDSVGGQFVVEARHLPIGLGSPVQWDRRLDARLAGGVMSIQGIKAVEVGEGVGAALLPGSLFHDAILPAPGGSGTVRGSNRAGGIEGGMSNGEPILLKATMKPIPSLMKPLPSVNLETGQAQDAVYERSDVCSVPAASVVGESMLALGLLDALLEKLGGDGLGEVKRRLAACTRSHPPSERP